MKLQSLVITLCITTLTACAVNKNDDAQVESSPESKARIEDRVRELTGQTMEDERFIVATPAPVEEKVLGERGKSEPRHARTYPLLCMNMMR